MNNEGAISVTSKGRRGQGNGGLVRSSIMLMYATLSTCARSFSACHIFWSWSSTVSFRRHFPPTFDTQNHVLHAHSIRLASSSSTPSTAQDPKSRAAALIDALPGNSVVSKTGWITLGTALTGLGLSKELLVVNEEVCAHYPYR